MLVRPSNILVVILFALNGISSLKNIKERTYFFFNRKVMIAVIVVAALLVWVPQIIYWYNVTGHFMYYSYTGESFTLPHSEVVNGLISWQKGWLIYTPVGWLMLAGFFLMPRYTPKLFWAWFIFFIAFIYLIFSWWSWYYGGSFSCRAIIDIYGVLAFPYACTLKYVLEEKRSPIIKGSYITLILLLISYNLLQTYQYTKGILPCNDMTYQHYKDIFLKLP